MYIIHHSFGVGIAVDVISLSPHTAILHPRVFLRNHRWSNQVQEDRHPELGHIASAEGRRVTSSEDTGKAKRNQRTNGKQLHRKNNCG